MAMAVVFAMLTSYLLTRTLVPTMVRHLLKGEAEMYQHSDEQATGPIWRVHHAFNRRFERMRGRYHGALDWSLHHRGWVAGLFAIFVLGSLTLALVVGRDFFPYVDSGQMRLHVRTPEGTTAQKNESRQFRLNPEGLKDRRDGARSNDSRRRFCLCVALGRREKRRAGTCGNRDHWGRPGQSETGRPAEAWLAMGVMLTCFSSVDRMPHDGHTQHVFHSFGGRLCGS